MKNLTFEKFLNADFNFCKNNPVLKYRLPSMVVADPSVLTPDITPDKKWHLLAHTFFGVYHYISDDGVAFGEGKRITNRAMRPDIKLIDGEYYLYFERTRSPLLNALNSVGVKPHSFLNTWVKWAEDANPTASPISETLLSEWSSSSLARSQRIWL